MKIFETPTGTYSADQIDPAYRDAGLADGSITEREATYPEALAECYRQRMAGYPSLNSLADATFHKENGNPTPMQNYLAAVQAVKVQYPKPEAPAPASDPTPTTVDPAEADPTPTDPTATP